MTNKVFLATFNSGKIERFKNLIAQTGLSVEVFTPADFNIPDLNIEENGDSLAANAEIKARAFFDKVDIPILANDTGFWVDGTGLVDAPKRFALGNQDQKSLTKEEIARSLLDFWKDIARKNGGAVDAAWVEAFVLLNPDGTVHSAESRREVILADQEFGSPHVQFPMRALYISKVTNKPALYNNDEEELLELQPITNALHKILSV